MRILALSGFIFHAKKIHYAFGSLNKVCSSHHDFSIYFADQFLVKLIKILFKIYLERKDIKINCNFFSFQMANYY